MYWSIKIVSNPYWRYKKICFSIWFSPKYLYWETNIILCKHSKPLNQRYEEFGIWCNTFTINWVKILRLMLQKKWDELRDSKLSQKKKICWIGHDHKNTVSWFFYCIQTRHNNYYTKKTAQNSWMHLDIGNRFIVNWT